MSVPATHLEAADMLLFMDRAMSAWARWSSYSSERLGFPRYAWVLDVSPASKATFLDLSDDEFVAIDRAVAKLERLGRWLIVEEWCTHKPRGEKASTFNWSRATYELMLEELLAQLYHALLPAVDDWRQRAPGYRR